MINVFFNSIAGKKKNDDIEGILTDLMGCDYISRNDKTTIQYSLDCSQKGRYPSGEYYSDYYDPSEKINSLSEIKLYVDQIKDFHAKESIVSATLEAVNDSNSKQDLLEALGAIIDTKSHREDDGIDDCRVRSYDDQDDRPENAGFLSGVSELDECTNGFQPGTVGTMCAFVSEGKSTFWVSAIYKNVKAGKPGVLVTLEMHPDIISMQFQSRFLYEEKGLEIRTESLVQRTLTSEEKKQVKEHDAEFKEMMKNLAIIDESRLSLNILKNPKLLQLLYRKLEDEMGGLDFVVWDHVNQFDLMYEGMGNTFIKTIQSAGKTYKNQNRLPIFTGLAAQTNRQGWEKATKKQGKYMISAISDLNEVERSSTYIMFMFTNEDMRITQETKVTLAKNRLGSLLPEPVVVTFNPQVMVVGDLMNKVEYTDDLGSLSAEGFGDLDDEF